jgi:IS4 transposase
LKEEHIHLEYKEEKEKKTLCLRKVTYKDEKNRVYQFITNIFEIANEEVALLYKLRWNIELLFKKLKQNFTHNYLLIFRSIRDVLRNSTPLLLYGDRKWHQNTNLVNLDSTAAFTDSKINIKK